MLTSTYRDADLTGLWSEASTRDSTLSGPKRQREIARSLARSVNEGNPLPGMFVFRWHARSTATGVVFLWPEASARGSRRTLLQHGTISLTRELATPFTRYRSFRVVLPETDS